MKKNTLLFACFLCLSFAGLQARAQTPADQAATQTGQAMGDTETKAKVQAKLQELASELNLNRRPENPDQTYPSGRSQRAPRHKS